MRKQLGATKETQNVAEKGLPQLLSGPILAQNEKLWDRNITDDANNWLRALLDRRFHDQTVVNNAIAFCTSCAADVLGSVLAHPLHTADFNDTIFETDSLAKAVQALNTNLMRMVYYDHIASFDLTTNASQSFFTFQSVPATSNGYWAVISMIVLHVLLCSIIFVQFTRTKPSMLNNSWQAVSQISNSTNPAVQEILRRSPMVSNDDVKDWIRERTPKGYMHFQHSTRQWFRPLPQRYYKIDKVLVEKPVYSESESCEGNFNMSILEGYNLLSTAL